MKKFAVALAAIFCSLAAALTGCSDKLGYTSLSCYFYSMNVDATLVLSDKFDDEKLRLATELKAEITQTLADLDASLSATNKNSYVSKFNAASAGEKVEIDRTTYEVLEIAQETYGLTSGFYNPAVYYSVLAYGFGGGSYPETEQALPSESIIEKYAELSWSFKDIVLSEEDGKYYALKPNFTVQIDGEEYALKIDLGGIGKGYATDAVNALLDEYGFEYGMFSFGMSSIACKKYYKGGGYRLELTDPRYETYGERFLRTQVSDKCLSASGDDVLYYILGGRRYCHIIDPTTGKPVQTGIMTATVIGGTAAEGDALTTAILAMGKERAVEFINESLSAKDLKVVFTYDGADGYEIITNMPEDEYSVLSEKYTVTSRLVDGKITLGESDVA